MGDNGSRSRRIHREYPGSPGETKEQNRSPNSETDPGTDLNHQGADHVFLDIGPAIRILQLNIEGISAAKREILSTICSKHNIDIICLQEVKAKADVSRGRLVIDNYDLVSFAGHQQHGRATYVIAQCLSLSSRLHSLTPSVWVATKSPTSISHLPLTGPMLPCRLINTQPYMWATSIATTQLGVSRARTVTATGWWNGRPNWT